MNVGDLVRVREMSVVGESLRRDAKSSARKIGLITDTLEGSDGFFSYEVVFEDDRGWFSDLELEVITDVST